jgi:hypothetical protein
MANKKSQFVPLVYNCETCDYTCCVKKDYAKHLSTRKHANANETNKTTNKKSHFVPLEFNCETCNKKYKHRSSLSKHKKTCFPENIIISTNVCSLTDETQILSNLVRELVRSNQELAKQNQDTQQQNQELQKHVIELCKNGTNNVTTNSNNKSFNINLFLNEQCKDALNLTQFVKGIEVSREDLMNTGNLGFVNGISKILLDNLKQLGVHERPIHCTDFKRDIVYIKDEDKWTKEEDDKKLRIAIQEVSRKSMGTLINWKKSNPDYADVNSEFSQQCISMQRNSVAGDDRETFFPKVIRALNKEMVVDKNLQN